VRGVTSTCGRDCHSAQSALTSPAVRSRCGRCSDVSCSTLVSAAWTVTFIAARTAGRPDAAREYGLQALDRTLDGVEGTTAVHICFGYAAIIHERPSGSSFLPELADSRCSR
jgi:hypothetical protein